MAAARFDTRKLTPEQIKSIEQVLQENPELKNWPEPHRSYRIAKAQVGHEGSPEKSQIPLLCQTPQGKAFTRYVWSSSIGVVFPSDPERMVIYEGTDMKKISYILEEVAIEKPSGW